MTEGIGHWLQKSKAVHCPDSCRGCRGPADEANLSQLQEIMDNHNIPRQAMLDRLECFGGFTSAIRKIDE
jgi:hypothetical protein